MMQVPSAMHTFHTHSIAAHGRSTGVYNIPVATQWLVQRLYYGLGQFIGIWIFDRHSLETLLKAYQVLMAHIDL